MGLTPMVSLTLNRVIYDYESILTRFKPTILSKFMDNTDTKP